MKLYGASVYGIKVSNETRLKWVGENHHNIISMDVDFIKKAKELPLFVAFCLEYRACMAVEEPINYESNLPILIDCTCNGIQHLAGMLLDSRIAGLVNLKNSAVIEDMYSKAARDMNKSLGKRFDGGDWSITRDMVKKIIMTVPYNATEFSAANYFIQAFVYNPETNTFSPPENKNVKLKYEVVYKLGREVYKRFFVLHPQLKFIVDYFKKMSDLMTGFNCGIV